MLLHRKSARLFFFMILCSLCFSYRSPFSFFSAGFEIDWRSLYPSPSSSFPPLIPPSLPIWMYIFLVCPFRCFGLIRRRYFGNRSSLLPQRPVCDSGCCSLRQNGRVATHFGLVPFQIYRLSKGNEITGGKRGERPYGYSCRVSFFQS